MDEKQRKQVQFSIVYVLIAFLGMWLFQELIFRPFVINQTEVPYGEFRQDLANGDIEEITFDSDRIIYSRRSPSDEEAQPPLTFCTRTLCYVRPSSDEEAQTEVRKVVPIEDAD